MAKYLFEKGHFVSNETKMKIRLSKLGKKRPDMTGEKNWNWTGGISKCIECGKILSTYGYKYCRFHGVRKGKLNGMWKGGLPNCIDCGIKLSRRTNERCEKDAAKLRIGIHKPNCFDCSKEISYGAKYCIRCVGKYRNAREIGLKGLIKQQNSKEPTSIEKAVYDYLVLKGVIFEKQKLINGKFVVDAYIPSLNLVIEADGNYWHTLDRVMKKDKAENAYLKKCGFSLVRLSEEEIKSGRFKERLVL